MSSNKLNRRCFLLKNVKLIKRALLKIHLSHVNVARVLGVCVAKSPASLKKLDEMKSSGVVVMRERGTGFDLHEAKKLPWSIRLSLAQQLLTLAKFLSESKLGSVLVRDWKPSNFQLDRFGHVKMVELGDDLECEESRCSSEADCRVNSISAGVSCVHGKCVGLNSMRNLFQLSVGCLFDLLLKPDSLNDEAQAWYNQLVKGLSTLSVNVEGALDLVGKLVKSSEYQHRNSKDDVMGNADVIDNSEVLFDSKYNDLMKGLVIHEIEAQDDNYDVIKDANENAEFFKPDGGVSISSSLDQFSMVENKDFPGKLLLS